MKNKRLLLLGAAVGALMAPGLVHAQTAKAVTVCNAQTYTNGQSYPTTQTLGGVFCDTGGSGGGGSGGNVTITGPIGAGADSLGVGVTLSTSGINALNNILANVEAPIPAQTSHNILIGAIEGNGTVASPDTHVVSTQGISGSDYANRANWIGNTTTVANTTAATVTPSPGAGISLFITDLECSNTSATAATVTFNDNPATILIVPAGGGNDPPIKTPKAVAGNTSLTMTLSANVSTVTCTDGGYKATT